jgi:hypothetical protein
MTIQVGMLLGMLDRDLARSQEYTALAQEKVIARV